MLAEIITIGDEILIGQIVDTNSAFISKELNKIGVQVYQITSIQDDKFQILQTFSEASKRASLVLVTGGLGPTKDDITKQCLCDFFQDFLIKDIETENNIKEIFKKYITSEPTQLNLNQALVPSKATVLKNENGTAPGMWFEKEGVVFISMPGVPYEMKRLLKQEVLPKVKQHFKRPFIYHKTLLTYGLGESMIAERIEDFENNLPSPIKLAYLPSLGRVRLRLSSKGNDEKVVLDQVNEYMSVLENLLKDIAIGFEDENNIVTVIGRILKDKQWTLGLAESCTGGAIATAITENEGVSSFFKGGIIPYATQLKSDILGVDSQLIDHYNVVSIPVAEAMAVQATKTFKSDCAIATTGIAGPAKGDGIDEVGTVCIAIATPKGVFSEKFLFGKVRERVIQKTLNKAFEMLLKEISKN